MQTVWYTVKEVAEMFRVCEQTVRNWIKGIFYDKGKARAYNSDSRLKATKFGKGFRIAAPDLERFRRDLGC